MELRVLHQTTYRYQAPVVLAQHLAYLRPRQCAGQTLLAHRLSIDPEPAWRDDAVDAFGNERTCFALEAPHESLAVCSDSRVEIAAPPDIDTEEAQSAALEPWEAHRDRLRYRAHAPYEPAGSLAFPSPFVPRHADFADYARASFTARRPWLEACIDLTDRMHRDFEYRTASTEIHTPALEALQNRTGVCQDFAHIMIGGLRSLGLPARYVSGYLLTRPPPGQPRLVGADASHAWVSVPCGDVWVDLDPTNNRWGVHRPGEAYVTLAFGRDFGDVSPLRGVIQGGGHHRLDVAVTVAPPSDPVFANAPNLAAPSA